MRKAVEIDYDEDAFNNVVQQSEAVGKRHSPVRVVVQVSEDNKNWQDWEVYDSGTRTTGVRLPSTRYLQEVARRAGTRYARSQKRANI